MAIVNDMTFRIAGAAGQGQSAGPEQTQEEPKSEAKPKDDIIDADFKEEK